MGLTRPRKPKVATRSNVLDKQDMAKKRSTKTISKTATVAPLMLVRPERKEVANRDIAARAHELFVARGGQPGRAMEDWLAAEVELTN